MKLKFSYIIICLFILSGCVHTYEGGRKFNFANIKLIEKNVTTKEDVIKLFGKPMEREVGTNNDEKWLYSSYVSIKDNLTDEENVSYRGLQIIFYKNIVHDFRHYEKYTSK